MSDQTLNGEKLVSAVFRGDLKEIRELLRAGTNVKYRNKYGNTALDWAVHTGSIEGSIEIVKLILSYYSNSGEVIESLSEENENLNLTPFSAATLDGHSEILKLFLGYYNYDELSKVLLEKANYGEHLLQRAAYKGQAETIKLILNYRFPQQGSNTALHLAVLNNNKFLAFTLLDSGANLNIPLNISNDQRKTAFDLAMERGDPYFVGLLNLFKAQELYKKLTDAQDKVKDKPENSATPSEQFLDKKDIGEKLEVKEKEEKLKGEDLKALQENLNTAILESKQIMENLQDLPKEIQVRIFKMVANNLAPRDPEGHALPPLDPVGAYEALRKIDEKSSFFREAQQRMYDLLAGHLILKPSPQGSNKSPIPEFRESLFPLPENTKEQKVVHEKSSLSLDEEEIEESQEPTKDIKEIHEKLTLEYKIAHILNAGLGKNQELLQPLYFHLAEFVYDQDMAAGLGEEIYKKLKEDNVENNPKACMKMLKLYQALAKTDPNNELLPKIDTKTALEKTTKTTLKAKEQKKEKNQVVSPVLLSRSLDKKEKAEQTKGRKPPMPPKTDKSTDRKDEPKLT